MVGWFTVHFLVNLETVNWITKGFVNVWERVLCALRNSMRNMIVKHFLIHLKFDCISECVCVCACALIACKNLSINSTGYIHLSRLYFGQWGWMCVHASPKWIESIHPYSTIYCVWHFTFAIRQSDVAPSTKLSDQNLKYIEK